MEKSKKSHDAQFSSEPSQLLKEAREFLKEGFAKARELHVNGATGREVLARLTTLIDDLLVAVIKALFEDSLGSSPPFSVVAVGGYGRGELSPGSDIDILLLCDNPLSKDVKVQVERLVYPLWDLKLDLGYAVRDPKGCVELAQKDFTVLTSLMDMRVIYGHNEIVNKLWERLREDVFPKTTEVFIKDHIKRVKERRRRYGNQFSY